MVQYFLNEPKYAEIYTDVLSYSDWVEKYGEKLNTTLTSILIQVEHFYKFTLKLNNTVV